MLVSSREKTGARPVSKEIVETAQRLAEVRATINKLNAEKTELTQVLEERFGKDSQNKVADYDTLIHRNLEVAKLKWITRTDIDRERLENEFPEAFEACQKENTYSVVKL